MVLYGEVEKMQVRIINNNPMFDYKHACLITKGKNIEKITRPENEVEYWVKQILTGHSTLRFIDFVITDTIPKSCIMQIIRATKGHPQPEVQSSRPDWTGNERSGDPYETKLFCMKFTPESFIEMCKQRLCVCTEAKTRAVVGSWVRELQASTDPLLKAIGICCKPKCFYFGGRCNELTGCGKYEALYKDFMEIEK